MKKTQNALKKQNNKASLSPNNYNTHQTSKHINKYQSPDSKFKSDMPGLTIDEDDSTAKLEILLENIDNINTSPENIR